MFAQLVHVRNQHSNEKSSFLFNPLMNKPLNGSIFASAHNGSWYSWYLPGLMAIQALHHGPEHWIILNLSTGPNPVVELFNY
jgi:hypothetical protein